MKMVSLKCPDCGANIELDSEREFGFCSYCGTKILINSEMNENEANVKIANINANIELEKMKMEKERDKNLLKIIILMFSFAAVMFFILMLLEM